MVKPTKLMMTNTKINEIIMAKIKIVKIYGKFDHG
jgi:hypothetical protein